MAALQLVVQVMTQEKYAFKMKLNLGMKAEYIKRHDEPVAVAFETVFYMM